MEKSPRINDNKKQIFESLPVPRAVAEMAVPTIISQIIALIYNIADTWFIGLTNDPYKVAGCSLVLPVFLNFCIWSTVSCCTIYIQLL